MKTIKKYHTGSGDAHIAVTFERGDEIPKRGVKFTLETGEIATLDRLRRSTQGAPVGIGMILAYKNPASPA